MLGYTNNQIKKTKYKLFLVHFKTKYSLKWCNLYKIEKLWRKFQDIKNTFFCQFKNTFKLLSYIKFMALHWFLGHSPKHLFGLYSCMLMMECGRGFLISGELGVVHELPRVVVMNLPPSSSQCLWLPCLHRNRQEIVTVINCKDDVVNLTRKQEFIENKY